MLHDGALPAAVKRRVAKLGQALVSLARRSDKEKYAAGRTEGACKSLKS